MVEVMGGRLCRTGCGRRVVDGDDAAEGEAQYPSAVLCAECLVLYADSPEGKRFEFFATATPPRFDPMRAALVDFCTRMRLELARDTGRP